MKSRPLSRNPLRRGLLSLERLEEREMPAGTVTISVLNNTLGFLGDGDALGNEVRVTATANNHFLIEGLNGTKLAGLGKPVSTIDTAVDVPNFVFPNNGSTKVSVKFLGGPDRFEYDGFTNGQPARQFADITLDMGAGNDTNFCRQFIAKNVTINSTAPTGAATDNDSVTIAAGGQIDLVGNDAILEIYQGGIKGNLTINAQTGNDTITLAATIGGNVTATLKDAGDSFTLRGASRVGGNVTVTEAATKVLGTTAFAISENTQIGKNVTLTNPANAANASVANSTIGGNLMLNSGSGAAGSAFSLTNTSISGNADVKGGTLQDTVNVQGVFVGKNLSLGMGDGGNGAGDVLNNINVSGNLTVLYGKGADILTLTNGNVLGNATVTAGDGQDRITVQFDTIGKNLSYTGGAGGNGGVAVPDLIDGVLVGGTVSVTYGAGNEALNLLNSAIAGAANIKGGNGNDSIAITNVDFHGVLNVTGGIGVDTVTLSDLFVSGATVITTSGGNDTVNITSSGRYKGKVTINTGGAGTDDDVINIEADTAEEVTFLGGVSIVTGAGNDTTTAGTSAGNVVILNSLTYAEAANLTDTFNAGVNLVIL